MSLMPVYHCDLQAREHKARPGQWQAAKCPSHQVMAALVTQKMCKGAMHA